MSVGCFADKAHQPTQAEIEAALGPRLSAWQGLVQFIRENYRAQEDFRLMYGQNYGWALRFRARGKLLTALYPARGGFTVQVILSPAAIEQAQQLKLGRRSRDVIARAHPYPEGRWLFIPVAAAQDLRDVEQLLALRLKPRGAQSALGPD